MKNLYLTVFCFLGICLAGCTRALPPPPPMPTIEDIPHTRKSGPIRPSCDSLSADIQKLDVFARSQTEELAKARLYLDSCLNSYKTSLVISGVCDKWEKKLLELEHQTKELIRKKKQLEDDLLHRCD